MPELPVGALAYHPAANGQRSVYTAGNGAIALRDPRREHDVAVLADTGRIERVAFSPDQSMVVVATVHKVSALDQF